MFSTAMSRKPAATSSGPRRSPVASAISSARRAKRSRTVSASSGSVGVRAEHRREVGGLDPAQHHVGVGDGQRAAAPVAGRAGDGTGRVRAHPVAAPVEVEHRAAARGDGVDVHHGRAHPHPGHLGPEDPLELARVVRHIGRRAAHVEADDPGVARLGRGAHHAHHAARGPRQHRVLAPEVRGLAQPAVGLHEHQPDAAQLGGHVVDVAAQDRREVGVDHGGVAARHQPHQRADLMRAAHLREAELAGRLADRALVRGVAVAVGQDDRGAAEAVAVGGAQRLGDGVEVQGAYDAAVRVHPLGHLDHPVVQRLRQHDPAVEEPRPVLVRDAQRVPETGRDDEHRGLALALQQGVGGDGGAHLDDGDPVGRNRFVRSEAQQSAGSRRRPRPGALGMVGQELAGRRGGRPGAARRRP